MSLQASVAMLVKCACILNKLLTVSSLKHPHTITPLPPCLGEPHMQITSYHLCVLQKRSCDVKISTGLISIPCVPWPKLFSSSSWSPSVMVSLQQLNYEGLIYTVSSAQLMSRCVCYLNSVKRSCTLK